MSDDGCQVCGEPRGRGRYGYPTSTCGGAKCAAELERRRQRRLRRRLSPTDEAALRRDLWKPIGGDSR